MMPRKGAGALLGLLMAGTLALAHANSAEPCRTVDANAVPLATVTTMQAAGWTADPADGAEHLYSPSCD